MMLYVSHREKATKVLGPGLRYALWLQGCEKRCAGCVFPEGRSRNSGGNWIDVEELFSEITAERGLTGVTISGGEPFLQAEPLSALVNMIRSGTKLDIMIYSGYTLAELRSRRDSHIDFILGAIDILIDGEYVESQNENQMYRGSANQTIHFLSSKYLPYKERIERAKNRTIEFVCHEDGELFIVGLPAKNFQEIFLHSIGKREMQDK